MKDYAVYNDNLKDILVDKGYRLKNQKPNYRNKDYTVYYFENETGIEIEILAFIESRRKEKQI